MFKRSLLFLLLMALMAPWAAMAQQNLADYTFSTGIDASKWVTLDNPTTILSTSVGSGTADSKYSALTDIGFTFPFDENAYEKFSVNSDGNLRLGNTVTGTNNYSNPFAISYGTNSNANANNPKINAFGCDGYLNSNHYVKTQLVESGHLVVEFSLITYSQRSNDYQYKWQIHLYSTGDIEIVFPAASEIPETLPSVSHQCGLCVNSEDGWVITSSDNEAEHFTNSSSTTNASDTWFDANRYYRFERPVIAYPKPTNLHLSGADHESASLAWATPEAGPNTLTGYAYEYKPASQANWSDDWTTLNDASATTLTVTSLAASTSYNFRMKALYGSNESDIVTTDFSTTAAATPVGDSWSDDFESASCGWELINGSQTNVWVWGTAVHAGEGTQALYVSNDNGTTNAYSNGSMSVVYAAKLLNFTDDKYAFDYNWMANGEGSYDYIHVWLAPGSFAFTPGQFPNGATTSFSNYTTLVPEGWISLTGSGKLNGQSSWQSKSYTINVTAGNWYVVFMWCNDTSGGSNPPAAIDNVSITRIACPYDVTNLTAPAIGQTSATLTWNGGEAAQWIVSYSANNSFEGATEVTVSEATYTIPNLTPATNYYVKVRAYCGGTDYGAWSDVYTFATECPDNYPLDYTCGFEGPNTTGSNPMPLCWTRMGTHASQPYVSTSQHHEGSGSLYLYKSSSSTYTNEIAALPTIDANLKDVRVVFYGKLGSSSTDGTINVGYVTSLTDASSFQAVDTVTLTTNWERHIVSLGGVGDAEGWIAFQAYYRTVAASIYIDDVIVEAIPDCVEPSGLAEVPETATQNSLTFNWTAGGTETTWKFQYKKTTETEWTTYPNAVTTKPFELPGLEASSHYDVRVAAWCTPSDPDGISGYSEPATAVTECGAFTVDAGHHYSDNFDNYTANTTSSSVPSSYPNDELPLCWSFLNRSQNSSNYPQVFLSSISNYAVSGNCLFFRSSKDTPLYAILPEFANNISDLMLTFTYRNEGTGAVNGTLYVSYMTDPTDATTFNTANQVECPQTTDKTEMEVFFDNAPAGSFIAFKYQGGSSNNYYLSIDDVTVEPVPSCRKPSNLACNSMTAHTATLSWTNGEEGQDAWQIAYSIYSVFAPADDFTPGEGEGLVDVTTNPATIEGLMHYTYHAYVRANCGGEYSAWCKDKVVFTPPTGNITPDGLAVESATITSEQATASWTGVATNDYHESYDIYWALATVTEVPEAPAAPNLISGITATSQVIAGLDPETDYKVWVRDNCGTDGYSDWSSAVTFTTAAACQTPDGLQASEVTDNSAKITWNPYGQTEFNLAYSADGGENWTTVNGIACPYTFPNNLQANKPYQVKVQATCNTEVWSSVLNFQTECSARTITATQKYNEDFEDPTTTATYNSTEGLVVPDCWGEPYATNSYVYYKPHIISKTAGNSYNFSNPTSQVLYFYGADGYVALPEFTNAISELQISFKWAVESTSNGTLKLGYITSEDNGTYNTFQDIASIAASKAHASKTMQDTTIYLDNVPAEAAQLVFLWTGTSNWYCNIDDLEVALLPSCYPVGTLSYDDESITSNSATLSWSLIDATQDAWQVQYATNAEFSEGVQNVNAVTNEDFVLGGLTPEIHYYVRVRGNCGTDNYSEWSNTVDFTTLATCPAPTNLTVTPTQYTADLTWNGDNDSYNIQYRTATQPTTNQIRFQGFEDGDLGEWTTVIQSTNATNQEECGVFEAAAKTGDYGFRFASANRDDSDDTYDQYLISPELNETGLLEFAYKSSNNYTESFVVGYSTSTNDLASFEWGTPVSFESQSWLTYSEQMPSDAKYFAIHYTSIWAYYVYIDDITILEMANAGEWTPTTAISTTEKSCQLTSLTAGTKYDVRVQGVCSGTPGNWSTTTFETVPYRTFTNSGFWTTASNWTPAGVPGPNDDVAIARGADIGATDFVKVRNITLLDGGDIEIFSNSTSIGQLWHSNAGVQAAVRVSFYGYDPDAISNNNSDYFLIASPFANEINIEDTDLTFAFDGPTDPNQREYDMYMFDQSCDHQEWRNYKADPQPFTTMVNGQGYLYSNAWNEWHTRGMYGQLQPSNEDVTITLAYTEGNQFAGWNLVGNPFACNAYVKDATDNIAAYYRMNSAGNGFTAATGAIKTAEGIFVQATAAGQSFKFSRTEPAVTSPGNGNLNINLAQTVTSRGEAGDTDNAIVRFDDGGTLEKFSFRDNTAKVYIPQDHKDYAVVNAENEGVLPLNFKAAENGNYTLSFTAEDVEFSYLHLIDNLTGTEVDLLATPSYNFDARYTDYASRFKLVFAKADNNGSDNFAFISNGEIILSGVTGDSHVQLFDITGRMLSHTNGTSHFSTENLAAGVYVLRLINGNDVKTQRIVVR